MAFMVARHLLYLKAPSVVCNETRVARLMRAGQIKSLRGYKRPRYKVGNPLMWHRTSRRDNFSLTSPTMPWSRTSPISERMKAGFIGCGARIALECSSCLEHEATHTDELGAGCTDNGSLP